jgi:hypothetical protein
MDGRGFIEDDFTTGVNPYWVRFAVGHGEIERQEGSLRFVVEAATASDLSDAQIDDYHLRPRDRLPWRPPLRMEVRARASHASSELLGTAGFGFWNDPFTGQGDVAASPNNLWFFFASPPSDMALAPGVPGRGWKGATLNSGQVSPLALSLGNLLLRVPGLERLLVRAAQGMVRACERLLDDVDITQWHEYELEWQEERAIFRVDGGEVLSAPDPPTMPLGFVAWMDNQWAIMRPDGEIAFGLVDVPQRQWLELAHVRIESLRSDVARPVVQS